MNKEKRRVPKLRFPGFTEDWEQRKLIDTAKTFIGLVTTMTENYRDSGTLLIRNSDIKEGQFVFSEKPIHLDEEFAEKNKTRRLQIGDVVTVHTGDIGTSAVIQEKEAGAIGFATINTRTDKRILNPYFLSTYFNTEKHKCYANSVSTGDGRSNYNIKDFNKLVISIPTLDEQEKISVLINNINTIITLHQRKLEHLILKKKALLQKLFPKNGERYPELRFSEFTDAWEQRKLGECMNSFAYGLNAAAKDYDGMHKYIRITDIDDETHNFIQSNLTSPDIDFNMDVSDYKLNVGDIVFARTGASVGKTYLYNPNDGDLYYAGFLIRGEVKEDCDAGFIYQNTLTKEYDSFIRITSQRSGQPGVNSKEYATFKLNIPCKDEQEKISKVLNSLDELYTLHQRKLEHLQLQKKALLQQMFV